MPRAISRKGFLRFGGVGLAGAALLGTPGFGGVLAEAGLLLSLEDAYQQRGWGIYEWAKQRATYHGTPYGVPDQVEEIVLFYNKNLVAEVPNTIGELRGVAEELKLRGTIP